MLICAGILLYKPNGDVFLTHPGGPFFAKRDDCWGIPKGQQNPREEITATARRELAEETGVQLDLETELIDLGSIRQSNKIVYGWAAKWDSTADPILKSNISDFGWPEIDKAKFFDLETAVTKMLPAQRPFLERLRNLIRPAA